MHCTCIVNRGIQKALRKETAIKAITMELMTLRGIKIGRV